MINVASGGSLAMEGVTLDVLGIRLKKGARGSMTGCTVQKCGHSRYEEKKVAYAAKSASSFGIDRPREANDVSEEDCESDDPEDYESDDCYDDFDDGKYTCETIRVAKQAMMRISACSFLNNGVRAAWDNEERARKFNLEGGAIYVAAEACRNAMHAMQCVQCIHAYTSVCT